jgi:hypothetical protein
LKRYALVTISVSSFLALAAASLPASAAIRGNSGTGAPRAAAEKYLDEPLCQSNKSLCLDTYSHAGGEYVGHDEPSVLFKSNAAGSGNNMTYTMTLPKDPKKRR